MNKFLCCSAVLLGCLFSRAVSADPPKDLPSDIPQKWTPATAAFDFEKRDVMIPMRDGVKLHSVILLPRGSAHAPILLTRTPYGAAKAIDHIQSTHLKAVLPYGDDVVSGAGYIRVFQDVRGKYGSEGSYVMSRPLRGELNSSIHRSFHGHLRHDRVADPQRTAEQWSCRHLRADRHTQLGFSALARPLR